MNNDTEKVKLVFNFYKKLELEPESIYINGDWIFTKERMFLIGVDKKKFFIKSVSFKSIS